MEGFLVLVSNYRVATRLVESDGLHPTLFRLVERQNRVDSGSLAILGVVPHGKRLDGLVGQPNRVG